MNNKSVYAHLAIVDQNGTVQSHTIEKKSYFIGRTGGANDIFINSNIVSSQHSVISYDNASSGYMYMDLASTNGTIIRGKLLRGVNGTPSQPCRLYDGDVMSIGSNNSDRIYMVFSFSPIENIEWHIIPITEGGAITIGRDAQNTIVIPNITVSRKHVMIKCANSSVTITDMNSTYGAILNGKMLKGTAPLPDASIIRLGSCMVARVGRYIMYGEAKSSYSVTPAVTPSVKPLPQMDWKNSVRVEVENVSRLVKCKKGTGINGGNKKYILSGVSLVINPGELVAILGGSGAGKTTFMNCINGFEPATDGRVYINGTDLYKNYQSIKASIGYVPQQDIVHDNLTLEDMLTYTGKLRLPRDVSKQEMAQRVNDVLEMVDLTAQKDTFIKKLSGGQRKRASIAVELVSDPSLFFLDEPTSGLDPEAETNLMHRLQDLSRKKGKTVIVITHTLQNIRLFDKVIFLAPGGKLCFYGAPAQAEKFFGVDNLADAYELISKDIDGTVARFNAMRQKGEI